MRPSRPITLMGFGHTALMLLFHHKVWLSSPTCTHWETVYKIKVRSYHHLLCDRQDVLAR